MPNAPAKQVTVIPQRRESLKRLTSREQQVADLLWMRDREIAAELGTSMHTVKCQVRAILEKTGAETRAQAALLLRERERAA